MADIFAMVDTWNNVATTFTAISMNVTDTASHANSLLMQLLVGSANRFALYKDGNQWNSGLMFGIGGSRGFVSGLYAEAFDVSIYSEANQRTSAHVNSKKIATFTLQNGGNIRFRATGGIAWTASSDPAVFPNDLFLGRDAAGVLAQRNGVNPQAFRIYNTYTDAANYEFGGLSWASNELRLTAEAAGTGTRRNVGMYYNPGDVGSGAKFVAAGTTAVVFGRYINIGKNASAGLISIDDNGLTFNGVGNAQPIKIKGLPTADPAVLNQLWNDGGTIKISAG